MSKADPSYIAEKYLKATQRDKPVPRRDFCAFNKYNPDDLLAQLVEILEKYELDDVVKEVKQVTPKVQKAWRSRDR